MNNPWKVCILDKDCIISHVFVFDANKSISDSLNPASLSFLKENSIHTNHVPVSIFMDDTIQTIKYKILYGIFSSQSIDLDQFSYEEMHIFSVIEKTFDVMQWYRQLTKNDTIPLTKDMLKQLLVNLSDIEGQTDEIEKIFESKEVQDKKVFTYEDIMSFPWFQNTVSIKQKIPLGTRMEVSLTPKTKRVLPIDEMFSSNPYDMLPNSEFPKNSRIVILDDEFLFHYGHSFQDNTIYLCLAENVLTEEKTKHSLFYFPYLNKKGIDSLVALRTQKEKLVEQSRNIAMNSVQQYQGMDIFYNIPREVPMEYLQNGITSFAFVIENNQYFQSKLRIPLESIFHNIQHKYQIIYL